MKTFGWDLCYSCNYRCPYCGIWKNISDEDLNLGVEDWVKVWKRIYDKYGSCKIFVSGGEPSTYPGFYDLIKKLSKLHYLDICTNLSWKLENVIEEISCERLTISPTLHPTFVDFEEFFNKVIKIKEYLPNNQIYCVAYSRNIRQMPEWSKKFKEVGIDLIPIPLRGEGYVINTEEEKKIIEEISPYRGDQKFNYQLQNISPKGRLCRAGKDYAVIRTNGMVDRCSQYRTGSLGNILDANFKLWDEPKKCDKDYCPIESQWIIENE